MANITSGASGNWDGTGEATPWIGGVAPAAGDKAIIAVGHTITKNTAIGAPDIDNLQVDGILDIGSNGIKGKTGTSQLTGTGEIIIGDNGVFDMVYVTTAVQFTVNATSGNEASIIFRGTGTLSNGGPHTLKFVDWQNTVGYTRIQTEERDTVYEDTWFKMVSYPGLFGDNVQFRRCFFTGGNNGIYSYAGLIKSEFFDCDIGYERDGTSATVTNATSGNGMFDFYNSRFNSTNPLGSNLATHYVIRSFDHNQVKGDFYFAYYGGRILRSTASKLDGTYGIEMIPRSTLSSKYPLVFDFDIAIDSGDTVAPSINVKNVTADMNIQDTAGLMTFELDPSNSWGLNEVIDADTLADMYNNKRTVTFTGGVASGSSVSGSITVRVKLQTYTASGVVYIADLASNIT